MSGNGSWTGRDPNLRFLRSAAALVILGLVTYTVIDPGEDSIVTLGTLVGALLVVLGFEAGVNWPKGDQK
jgi:hypothetical protein